MPIEPDDKDWTWVLERACPECGFDTREVDAPDVAGLTREVAASWEHALAAPAEQVRIRPAPGTWSTLEYGAHVRDVFVRFDERLRLMLNETDPLFPNWDQDSTAIEDDYAGQDPAVVAHQLAEAGERIAASFDGVTGDEWVRTGARSDGARFTVASFARYFIHDPVHHLYDVTGERR